MKVVLDKTEYRYLYALFKLMAAGMADKRHGAFYANLADQVSPNRAYSSMSKDEVQLLLDILASVKLHLNQVLSKSDNAGSILRADVLNKVVESVTTKLQAKLAEGEENGI